MTGWYSSSWKARSLEYGEGGGFPPPFSYATKQSGGDKTHRPPDTAARLRPTKQPVCFTTERAVCDTLLSCEFNMDTGCVELRYSDDSMISINCTAVEDEVANSRFQRSELDWLIYNDPLSYAALILNGDPEKYLRTVTEIPQLDSD